jgi:hypothetical protein
MSRRHYSWMIVSSLTSMCFLAFSLARSPGAHAQGQFPIADQVAEKIIQKYQNSSCEQLWAAKAAHAPPSMEEQRAIGILKSDPQMRTAFIAKIAPAVANKMFDCGMIP